ncbi:MAG: glutaminyl-peptide cyclotransferase [Tidjanibacter sp.]|nr:glutaminyl-peptide cyclotransferase [Tidjanibacter sp.]
MRTTLFIVLILVASVSCGGGRSVRRAPAISTAQEVVVAPERYTYRVVNLFPHSEQAYTQGLEWHNGKMIEGTGGHGESQLRRVELSTGLAEREIDLPDNIFGEGITLLDGLIYQITWTEGRAMVYEADTFKKVGEFRYDGQGWGLTNDGSKLYMSDGSDRIVVRDPKTFEVERTISVRAGRNRVRNLNELEWIDGEIWANVYLTDQVMIIDPADGRVRAVVDFAGLQSPRDVTRYSDVLNGIAYDASTGRIFVTGKRWNKLYEVEIIKKQ